jgi:hypothetical protein
MSARQAADCARTQLAITGVQRKAATSAATPMMTPVVESVVRVGLVRKESAPTRADSISAAAFTLKRLTLISHPCHIRLTTSCAT